MLVSVGVGINGLLVQVAAEAEAPVVLLAPVPQNPAILHNLLHNKLQHRQVVVQEEQ